MREVGKNKARSYSCASVKADNVRIDGDTPVTLQEYADKISKVMVWLASRLDKVEQRLSAIEGKVDKAAADEERKVSEGAERKRRVKEKEKVILSVLDKMEAEGKVDFDGMTSAKATTLVLVYAEVTGIDGLDDDRGTRKMITNRIRSKFGYDLDPRNGYRTLVKI